MPNIFILQGEAQNKYKVFIIYSSTKAYDVLLSEIQQYTITNSKNNLICLVWNNFPKSVLRALLNLSYLILTQK